MLRWGLLLFLAGVSWALFPGDIKGSFPGGTTSLPFLGGLRAYNSASELLPPFLMRTETDTLGFSNQITIEFDVGTQLVPDLEIVFYHCDRDWVVDDNEFLRNEFHNRSFRLDYTRAPLGVSHYTYRFVNRFPDTEGIVQFPFSGNHIFEIVDRETSKTLATARFIVIDPLATVAVKVDKEYIADAVTPMNQAHRVRARVQIPEVELLDTAFVQLLYEGFVTTVDIYQNQNLWQPHRVSFSDDNVWTLADWTRPSERVFEHRRIYPGNYSRRLDISDERLYPRGRLVRLVSGVDLPRYLWQGTPDLRGGSKFLPPSGIYSDYLKVEFRLRVEPAPFKDVFVVGSFNHWAPTSEDQLQLKRNRQAYIGYKWLRRGIYDYYYILGWWDPETKSVIGQDWFTLEGNDWRTVRDYYVVVYYDDPRYGGFDRIIGIGKDTSPGVPSSSIE